MNQWRGSLPCSRWFEIVLTKMTTSMSFVQMEGGIKAVFMVSWQRWRPQWILVQQSMTDTADPCPTHSKLWFLLTITVINRTNSQVPALTSAVQSYSQGHRSSIRKAGNSPGAYTEGGIILAIHSNDNFVRIPLSSMMWFGIICFSEVGGQFGLMYGPPCPFCLGPQSETPLVIPLLFNKP